MRRIAMISVPHLAPGAAGRTRETGGMNVYVRELSRELGQPRPAGRRLHPSPGPMSR